LKNIIEIGSNFNLSVDSFDLKGEANLFPSTITPARRAAKLMIKAATITLLKYLKKIDKSHLEKKRKGKEREEKRGLEKEKKN